MRMQNYWYSRQGKRVRTPSGARARVARKSHAGSEDDDDEDDEDEDEGEDGEEDGTGETSGSQPSSRRPRSAADAPSSSAQGGRGLGMGMGLGLGLNGLDHGARLWHISQCTRPPSPLVSAAIADHPHACALDPVLTFLQLHFWRPCTQVTQGMGCPSWSLA